MLGVGGSVSCGSFKRLCCHFHQLGASGSRGPSSALLAQIMGWVFGGKQGLTAAYLPHPLARCIAIVNDA